MKKEEINKRKDEQEDNSEEEGSEVEEEEEENQNEDNKGENEEEGEEDEDDEEEDQDEDDGEIVDLNFDDPNDPNGGVSFADFVNDVSNNTNLNELQSGELKKDEVKEEIKEENEEKEQESHQDQLKTQSNRPLSNNDRNNPQSRTFNSSRNQEEDLIKQETLRKLMEIDIESSSKEDVVNILLNTEVLNKKDQPKKESKAKLKINAKSHYSLENLNSDPIYKNNFYINATEKDPEFTNDFKTATKKILHRMCQSKENEELLKILITDKNKFQSDLEVLEHVNKDNIENKVKFYLSKKQKNLEKIDERMKEEFMQKYTFNPEIISENRENNTVNRRNWDQFLTDQETHMKRVQEKIKMAKDEMVKKENQIIQESHPKVDQHSEKIFQEKIKTEDPTHLRLYKKRFNNAKNEVLGKTEKNIQSSQGGVNSSSSAQKKFKSKQKEDYTLKLYKKHDEKKEKLEKLKNKIESERSKSDRIKIEGDYSNKFFLQNIMDKYRKILCEIISEFSKTFLICIKC